jgi:trans-2,3-dihydro-3-hydroxyanthranilate isomerase
MTLDYHVVDVFTETAFAGNPLAVVLDAEHLTTAQMQAIAREFNLSETTFPLPPATTGADYRLRIFTPQSELPFAGHPSVGSAWLLHELGRLRAGRVVQECGAGLLPIEIDADAVTLFGGTPHTGPALPADQILPAVGLAAEQVTGTPVRMCGVGLDFAFLHVHPDAVAAARIVDFAALAAVGSGGLSVFSYDAGRAHARVFAAGAGVPEDPATGSAALGLGVFLVASGLVGADATTSYVVEQGIEMGRPSRLACTVRTAGGRVEQSSVAGSVVRVAQGRIRVP